MYLQFIELSWPEPDLITFVPQSFFRSIQRGYNVSELLAKELSRLIDKPVLPLLKKTESTISQTQLERKDRQALLSTTMSCKEAALAGNMIEDKVVLLIDDVCTTGTTIDCAASALQAGHPKRVYALTLCRS
jgi:predicted amidophosphoribosyltransferase